MAKLDLVQTGATTLVHYRGRIMRVQADKDAPASKERRTVCVLSLANAAALLDWGIAQPCYGHCNHAHHTRELVDRLVQNGALRWIGKGKNIAAWIAGREWKPVPSGPERVDVLQFV